MTIQSLGVGSGLALDDLVQQLLTAERQPKEERLNAKEERIRLKFLASVKLNPSCLTLKMPLMNYAVITVLMVESPLSLTLLKIMMFFLQRRQTQHCAAATKLLSSSLQLEVE